MTELVEILIQAIDEASETFQSIVSSADDAASSLEEMGTSAEDIPTDAITETAEAVDQVEQEADETASALDNISNVIQGIAGVEVFSTMADALMDCADKAGNYSDSIMRASLEAEGAGISVNAMTDTVSRLSSETGRAGGQIREAFITATARGITNLDSFKTMMEGAGAQATLFNTDIETMGNKFSQMAMRSTLMERGLASTGITMAELAEAMGMAGATADEVKDKWKELDTNQRAAVLGMAASMNEGEEANEAYKNSWAGLHEQIDIAKGRLERLVGQILLPVLIPAMKAAANVLNWLGGVIDGIMSGPLGGLVSAIGAVAAGIALAVPAIAAIQAGLTLFTASIWPAVTASWALIAPWLPFIAIGAAVVLVIYEIGKAFGWWDDASGMIDAISAGLQRLWDAFINHPDVQAALEVIGEAFEFIIEAGSNTIGVVLEFFDVANGGDFDVVSALIYAVGAAWDAIRGPILFIIDYWRQLIDIINQFRTGQIDLPTFIWNILSLMANTYMTVFNTIMTLVANFGKQLLSRLTTAARNAVNGAVNQIKQLPGKVASFLSAVLSKIISIGAQWVSNASSKASSIVSTVVSTLSSLPSRISSALSGVVDAIVKPFSDAYSKVSSWVSKIASKASEAASYAGGISSYFAGGDFAAGEISVTGNHQTLDVNYNINLDLSGVPAGMSTNELINALTNREVLSALTGNRDFQTLDAKVKGRMAGQVGRARGV